MAVQVHLRAPGADARRQTTDTLLPAKAPLVALGPLPALFALATSNKSAHKHQGKALTQHKKRAMVAAGVFSP